LRKISTKSFVWVTAIFWERRLDSVSKHRKSIFSIKQSSPWCHWREFESGPSFEWICSADASMFRKTEILRVSVLYTRISLRNLWLCLISDFIKRDQLIASIAWFA
jgi:hypothetical protein